MKPTGFEEFFADAPITPAAFEEEQSIYDRFVSFIFCLPTDVGDC